MASITNESNGRRTIQLVCADGARRSIRLGTVSKRHAEAARLHIEELVSAAKTGQHPAPATKEWIRTLDERVRVRLAKIGLIEASFATSLEDLIQAYMKRRKDLKPKTRKFLLNAANKLESYFGSQRKASSITPAEAADWRRWMLQSGLSEATARTYARGAKQIFRDAVDRKLVDENPFSRLPSGSVANTNDRFITSHEIDKVIDACPNDSWRALLVLCRYAGLRCPSETHVLRWCDLDLANRVMNVQSPKTEHHIGHEKREVPIQPVVHDALVTLNRPDETDAPVISLSKHNLHKTLARIIATTDVEPWADPFHCLRRSCQTEWAQTFPEYAVAAWIGNSTVVARRHYLKIPEDLLRRASGQEPGGAESGAVHARSSPYGPATQTRHERGRQR